MDMMSHISFITCRISGIDLHVLLGMCVLLCEHGIACELRWRVTLVGVYSTRLCSPRHGTPFQVQVVHRMTTLLRGRDFEGNWLWLWLYFLFYFEHTFYMYIFLYKRCNQTCIDCL